MKKLLSICLAALLLLSMAGCGKTDTAVVDAAKTDTTEPKTEGIGTHRAEIEIQDYGTVTVELDGDAAPITVQNFMDLANAGFYNGLTFHRIIAGFMMQGGDPNGNGTGGQSIWGEPFEDEFSKELHNFRGALSMANSGENTNGSQFFIVQANTTDPSLISQMKDLPDVFGDEVAAKYEEIGGTPWLDYRHTVFGQVIKGMDVVDAIAGVETDANDMPVDDVIIENIEFKTFGELYNG